MDPLTQGVVAASATQLVANRRHKVAAGLMGFFAGLSADLDVLISSSTDPLLFLEYHRHFTHALVFIPVGALLCSLVFRVLFRSWFRRRKITFATTYLYCFAGYATHAVLDACTTYGTQLFWPFSDYRVAWNNVSVVDPLFTLPLLACLFVTLVTRSNKTAVLGAVYAFAYLGLGVVQQNRAADAAQLLAESRGHTPVGLGVKPSFGNLIVWKSVYEHAGKYYVDAVRVFDDADVYLGTSIDKLDLEIHFPWLNMSSQQAADIERFRWFSNSHLGVDPNNANRIIDVRYSLIPNQVTGMWGIVLSRNAPLSTHVKWTTERPQGREAFANISQLWSMIAGRYTPESRNHTTWGQ